MSLPFAAGSLYSTVEDLYRWNIALHSEALLSQASLSQMFASHTPLSYDDETATGYGWVIVESDGLRMFVHDGWINGYSSRLSYYPDDELTIIILSNLESALLHNLHIKLFELVTEEAATSSR